MVVIGAGPVGLATAAELTRRDQEVIVLEQGQAPAAAVRQWGHVRLFSPWSEVTSPAAVALLEATGWSHPEPTAYPTGADWVRDYLDPLATVLGDRVRTGHRVLGVARSERDLLVDSGREGQPFVLHVERADGSMQRLLARAVVDCSGTWGAPNPLGAEGYPAAGETAAVDRILYEMPDGEADRDRFAGAATAVVGSGASALTALIALTSKPLHTPDSHVVWVVRRGTVESAFGGGELDELPARGALGTRVRAAVDARLIEPVTGFRVTGVQEQGATLALLATDGRRIEGLDQVVGATGFRPDLSFLSEVRLNLDPRLQAPVDLAPGIDPNLHSCGSVQPHGHDVLAQPEGDLFLAGMKSYGRAPSFLAMTGYEQVRSIAAALAGDLEAARAVELTLPDTGVCGGAGLFDEEASGDGGCCGTPQGPESLTLTGVAGSAR
ncbi:NAD(P)-binding domain-containing protein [Ornithinicoccus hortensis]|uniref:Cation diffusion facilitator CzcD-associated flavoprotein CzcO n=1 Tax=Ornithinicoccus hortensis TaxID=82346 RepID=A0A542YUJ8_9MICO|nr:cation diffusion facilitator CzcD-associated flavoprotein CzcO [Ornithinicoccus hortensis]